ncbi:Flagellar basal-body/hook protein C-terminal domain-containing protein [Hyphomicrobium sp. 1Nfss2.1]
MFSIIATAANGMATQTQAQRIEAVAQEIAAIGTTPTATQPEQTGGPVRIGALPLGDVTPSIVTLVEAEQAYEMNALVLATAVGMIDTLLDVVQPAAYDRRR